MKQKVNRFWKVLIKPIKIFTKKKWLLIILTTWSVGISLQSPHSATTPRILTSLKFPIKINWPVELCHQLCFSDMFKPFVSLKMVKMLSKIPKCSHASDILYIKRSKWRCSLRKIERISAWNILVCRIIHSLFLTLNQSCIFKLFLYKLFKTLMVEVLISKPKPNLRTSAKYFDMYFWQGIGCTKMCQK